MFLLIDMKYISKVFKKSLDGYSSFSGARLFEKCHFFRIPKSWDMKNNRCNDVSIIFWYFLKYFGIIKMSKYGLLRVQKSINHENVKFLCLKSWNRNSIVPIWSRKIYKALKPIFQIILLYKWFRNRHNYVNLFPVFSYDFRCLFIDLKNVDSDTFYFFGKDGGQQSRRSV